MLYCSLLSTKRLHPRLVFPIQFQSSAHPAKCLLTQSSQNNLGCPPFRFPSPLRACAFFASRSSSIPYACLAPYSVFFISVVLRYHLLKLNNIVQVRNFLVIYYHPISVTCHSTTYCVFSRRQLYGLWFHLHNLLCLLSQAAVRSAVPPAQPTVSSLAGSCTVCGSTCTTYCVFSRRQLYGLWFHLLNLLCLLSQAAIRSVVPPAQPTVSSLAGSCTVCGSTCSIYCVFSRRQLYGLWFHLLNLLCLLSQAAVRSVVPPAQPTVSSLAGSCTVCGSTCSTYCVFSRRQLYGLWFHLLNLLCILSQAAVRSVVPPAQPAVSSLAGCLWFHLLNLLCLLSQAAVRSVVPPAQPTVYSLAGSCTVCGSTCTTYCVFSRRQLYGLWFHLLNLLCLLSQAAVRSVVPPAQPTVSSLAGSCTVCGSTCSTYCVFSRRQLYGLWFHLLNLLCLLSQAAVRSVVPPAQPTVSSLAGSCTVCGSTCSTYCVFSRRQLYGLWFHLLNLMCLLSQAAVRSVVPPAQPTVSSLAGSCTVCGSTCSTCSCSPSSWWALVPSSPPSGSAPSRHARPRTPATTRPCV